VIRSPTPPHSRIEIGRRLKATRQALGLRTRDVHRATGIAESTWSQYENGRRFPDLLQILPFAERFGISLDWIYRGIITAVPYEIAQRVLDAQLSAPEADPDHGEDHPSD
jgi:transcriptional regulator with XRE-family HTH domain